MTIAGPQRGKKQRSLMSVLTDLNVVAQAVPTVGSDMHPCLVFVSTHNQDSADVVMPLLISTQIDPPAKYHSWLVDCQDRCCENGEIFWAQTTQVSLALISQKGKESGQSSSLLQRSKTFRSTRTAVGQNWVGLLLTFRSPCSFLTEADTRQIYDRWADDECCCILGGH